MRFFVLVLNLSTFETLCPTLTAKKTRAILELSPPEAGRARSLKINKQKMNLSKIIETYANQFTTKQRGTGNDAETITIFKNESPELHEAVFKAHGERLPNDWIFSKFREILETLEDYTINSMDDIEEYRAEIVDGLVDVYTHDLTAWLHDSVYNVYYIDEAREEYGTDASEGSIKMLMQAQYKAIDDIYSHVYALLEANAQNDDE